MAVINVNSISWYRWPRSPTMYMTSKEVNELREWLENNCNSTAYYVEVRKRQFTRVNKLYSTKIYVANNSAKFWTLFKLTWG